MNRNFISQKQLIWEKYILIIDFPINGMFYGATTLMGSQSGVSFASKALIK